MKLVSRAKRLFCSLVMWVLWQAFRYLVAKDSRLQAEFARWQDPLSIRMDASPQGPSLVLAKEGGRLCKKKCLPKTDIVITFKSISAAFLVFSGQQGVARAWAEHRFILKGDINQSMSMVRCIDLIESYLFPRFITSRFLTIPISHEIHPLKVYGFVLCALFKE